MSKMDRVYYTEGFFNSIFASVMLGASDKRVAEIHDCTQGMNNYQLSEILYKYIKENPEKWHYGLQILSANAIRQLCKLGPEWELAPPPKARANPKN